MQKITDAALYISIFNRYTDLWQRINGSSLGFVSAEGALLAQHGSFDLSGCDFAPLGGTRQTFTDAATQRHLLAVPLVQADWLYGYLVTEIESTSHAWLLDWIVQEFLTSIADTNALKNAVKRLETSESHYQQLIARERTNREREIAAQIQKSSLPSTLPQVGGLSLAVSSLPATEVGGDFYDFITTDDQHLTLVIGDVSSKGIDAARLTTIARTLLRSEIVRGEPPHTTIERVNALLYNDLSDVETFITVFVATIDTQNGTITYANAGHLAGLVWQVETQKASLLKPTSLPLGIYGDSSSVSQTITFQTGDSFILVTDGIVEARAAHDDIFGVERLIRAMEQMANDPPEKLQRHIQSEVSRFQLGEASNVDKDDATLLIVKMTPQPSLMTSKDISTIVKTVQYNYCADTTQLAEISQKVTTICREMPSLADDPRAEDFIHLVELATSEICTNIIRHAYQGQGGDIKLHITLMNNAIQLDLYDNGIGFDPQAVPVPHPNRPQEGGYGLHIIRQIMDVVSYEHHPEKGNHWHLLKMYPAL